MTPLPPVTMSKTAKKVLGFLVAKGLLHSTNFKAQGAVKLSLNDFIVTAEEIEPRVLAVLPAALIHFPRTFIDRTRLPKHIEEVVSAIERGDENGPSLFGIPFTEMRRWAHAMLKDKRVKPLGVRKIRKTYRFSPKIAELLESEAARRKTTETSLIEHLVAEKLAGAPS